MKHHKVLDLVCATPTCSWTITSHLQSFLSFSAFLINCQDRIIRVFDHQIVLSCKDQQGAEPEPIQKLQDLVNRYSLYLTMMGVLSLVKSEKSMCLFDREALCIGQWYKQFFIINNYYRHLQFCHNNHLRFFLANIIDKRVCSTVLPPILIYC